MIAGRNRRRTIESIVNSAQDVHATKTPSPKSPSTTGALIRVLSSQSYGFRYPTAIAGFGSHVWVLNCGSACGGKGRPSVTEISASSGALLRVIGGARDGFLDPLAISVDRDHVWIANWGDYGVNKGVGAGSVTELSANGSLVRVLDAPMFHFEHPEGVSSDGTHVWVASCGNDCMDYYGASITELSASTGALVRVVDAQKGKLGAPGPIVSDGHHVWVADCMVGCAWIGTVQSPSGYVSDISAVSGGLDEVLDRSSEVNFPTSIATSGAIVAVTDCGAQCGSGTPGVTVIQGSTGAVMTVLKGPKYDFDLPTAIAIVEGSGWVANLKNDTVTEFPISLGQ
jgi:hypothetical protein